MEEKDEEEEDAQETKEIEEKQREMEMAAAQAARNSQALEVAILFHLSSPSRDVVPRVDPSQVSRALGGAGQPEWSARTTSAKARLVCMRYASFDEADSAWKHFDTRQASRRRRVFHLGQALEVRAVSRQEVTAHECGFKVEMDRHNAEVFSSQEERDDDKEGNGNLTTGKGCSDATASTRDLKLLDFPALLDILGDQIVSVRNVFALYQDTGTLAGRELIALALHESLDIPIEEVDAALCPGKVDVNALATAMEMGEPCFALAHFCRLCVAVLQYSSLQNPTNGAGQRSPERLRFSESEAESVFASFKLFPRDDFIESYDVAPALRSLGLPADDDKIMRDLDAQSISRVRLAFFLSLANGAARRHR
ncbi:Hypothetical Protein FCC1311_004762 [Hondaea fermentalgiana]|uniref:Uncharacterized protein n=1 Tax=Hondaea fermentalgiana TaxID=2315210 RepID=A0A2R5G3D7_9STRA|nr:Hypothetical Protein FCC1311_004762 [Hondaea fermentalgiana]|eukprot:GBG24258.1 Hypothetical Protein FCC1311_004762 [Hondaea fermentalgiana]